MDMIGFARDSALKYSQQCDLVITNPVTNEVFNVKGMKSDKSKSFNPEYGLRSEGRISHVSVHSSLLPRGVKFLNWIVEFDSNKYKVAVSEPNKTTGLIVFVLTDKV